MTTVERVSVSTHNLPALPTSFVGRTEELANLSTRLKEPGCRLLTLVGPGGNGKTRLAIELAGQEFSHFANGVYFVFLQPLSSPALLAAAIAETIGFSFYGQDDPEDQLLSFLSEKQILLLLDNFEHLLEAADLLAQILTAAPEIKILVTSREALNLQEEWVWHVTGMRFPLADRVDEIDEFSALKLFAERARRVRQDFSPEAEQACMIRICQLVGGTPLALELAAAWLKTLPCDKIVREIERSLDFLATNMRNIPERHRSMRAVFEQSWILLSEDERQVLKRLSLFRSGFRQAAAQAVAGASLLTLSSLVDKSLLHVNNSGRFEFHELLRQYAEERLERKAGERERILESHCSYYADFLYQRRDDSKGPRQVEFMREIGEEIDNLRVAWNQAIADENLKAIDQSLESLWRFFAEKSWYLQGDKACDKAVTMLRRGAAKRERGLILGRVLASQGHIALFLGSHEKSRVLAQESLAILDNLGAHQETIVPLGVLAVYYLAEGPIIKAQQYLQEMLKVARESGDHWAMAMTQLGMSRSAKAESDYQKAKQHLDNSLDLFRQIGDQWGVAWGMYQKSRILCSLGQYQEALQQARESQAIAKETDSISVEVVTFAAMGDAAYALGQFSEAKRHYQEGLALTQETSATANLPRYLVALADIARLTEEPRAATTRYQHSLQVAREINDAQSITRSLQGLGNIEYDEEEYHQAYDRLQESLALTRAGGWQELTISALNSLGLTAHALGQDSEASGYFKEALVTALTIGALPALLKSIVATAGRLAGQERSKRMVPFLTFAQRHPATHSAIRLRAERLLDELAAKLPPDVFTAAQARGATEEPQAIAKTLLIEMGGMAEDQERRQPQLLAEPLSDREIEVLRHLAEGMTNREIADELFITVGTAKVHASNIYGKLGVHNRTQAVVRGQELELL